MINAGLCYLCGDALAGETSNDHVPPQQFFAPELRRRFNLDSLTTVEVHASCNRSFSLDEEYVINALAPLATGAIAADAFVRHQAAKFQQGRGVGLIRKVLSSMEERPSGLVLPRGLVAVRLDGARVSRVVWKIVRGLYFMEYGAILLPDDGHIVELREPENRERSEHEPFWNALLAQPSRGNYQAVFAHKHMRIEREGIVLFLWAMLWWDKIMVFVAHAPKSAAAPADHP